MIDSKELLSFLDTIASTVSHELRPDLVSGHAKKSADYLIQVLDRLVAEVRDSERIAADRLTDWQSLRRQFPATGGIGDALPAALPRDKDDELQHEIAQIQRELGDDAVFADMVRGCADPASAQSNWFRQAAAAACALMNAIEDSVEPAAKKSVEVQTEPDPEQLRLRLSAYLEKHYPQLPENAVTAFRVTPGGSCKLTALFSLPPNPALPERLVLRQDLAMSIAGAQVRQEFPIVERVCRLGLKVPRPILLETDASILGGAFMIMTQIEDAEPAGTYFAKERAMQPRLTGPEFGRDAARELARLHHLTTQPAADPGATAAAYRDALDKAHEKWKALPKPPHSVVMDMGFAWLKSHPVAADRPSCLIHGDYSLHNMMVRDGRLAAVLDWELAQEGDPAHDLAECRMILAEDTLAWEDFVAEYLAAGGDPRACDADAVAYQCVWLFVKLGVMHAEARNYYLSGARTDSLTASVAGKWIDRTFQYLARALQTVSAA